MKTKKQFTSCILSLVLTLLLVVGLMPMTAYAASASATYGLYTLTITEYYEVFNATGNRQEIEIGGAKITNISLNSDGDIVCKFRAGALQSSGYVAYGMTHTVVISNTDCREELNAPIDIRFEGSISMNHIKGTLTRPAQTSHTGGQSNCTSGAVCAVCGTTYGSPNNNHSWGEWTTSDGTHTRTCMLDSNHTETGDCDHKPATCLAASVCSVCKHEYAGKLEHNLTYTSKDNVLTETCNNGCGHSATATLTATDTTYTGSPITTGANLLIDPSWIATTDLPPSSHIQYSNNLNAGEAIAQVTIKGNELTTTFRINPASINGAVITVNPSSATYNGTAFEPSVSVDFNGVTLVEDTDYTLSWNKSGFTNADTYSFIVTGKGNFDGAKDAQFTIHPTEIKNAVVTLDQNTFVYDGQPHKPTATVTFNGVALTAGVDYELYYMSEDQIRTWNGNEPLYFFGYTSSDSIKAGQYYAVAVGKGNYAASSRFAYAKYTIEKAAVTEPTIESKPYNGTVQKADITDTDLYTVVKNDGGEGVKQSGYYDVVLELKDPANYTWSSTDNTQLTLPFAITRAENEWTVTPSVTGWTYGKPAGEPVGEARFGEVSVEYSGTTNAGESFSGTYAPTEAGNYTATFIVQETEDYRGLEASADFTVAKANYNMAGAGWVYSAPFRYDGKEHTVEVTGLPAGVTVESYENNTAAAVGDYYARAKLAYDTHNYNAPAVHVLGWTIYNDWTPAEYTVNGSGWMNKDFVITANDGYKISLTNTADGEWKDALTCSAETADGSVSFYLKDETDGAISLGKTVSYKLDTTAPTGVVEFVERSSWEEFVHTITFGLFYKDEVTVKITGADNLSGVAKIEYYASGEAMSLAAVESITDWTEYNGEFGVALEDTKQFVYFVRITDNAGNVTLLSTDGAEYDTTAPVIEGIENGKTYYTTQRFQVQERNLDSVTVNGNPSMTFALGGNVDKEYVIVATDTAGNTTTVTVTMKPIQELAKATENLGPDNVTSADAPALEELIENLEELIADPNTSSDSEMETLEQHKSIAESLLQTIEDAAKAADTENTQKVTDVTPENVTREDKTDLEKAQVDLEKALEDNGGNYTEEEKSAIGDALERIDDALTVIGNAEAVEDLIHQLPENITKSDEDAIEKADDAYNALTDYEKSLVDGDAKQALDDAKAALAALNKPVDPDYPPATGDDSNLLLWFSLLFASGMGVFGLALHGRKRKQ